MNGDVMKTFKGDARIGRNACTKRRQHAKLNESIQQITYIFLSEATAAFIQPADVGRSIAYRICNAPYTHTHKYDVLCELCVRVSIIRKRVTYNGTD